MTKSTILDAAFDAGWEHTRSGCGDVCHHDGTRHNEDEGIRNSFRVGESAALNIENEG